MHPDASVVFDEAESAKAIHEKTDARPSRSDHLCQGFLCDLGDQTLRFARLSKIRHQQKNPCQASLAGVEKLVDQISLGTHAAGEKKLKEQVGEAMLLMHDADHLVAPNPERGAGGNGGSGGQAQARDAGWRQPRQSALVPPLR